MTLNCGGALVHKFGTWSLNSGNSAWPASPYSSKTPYRRWDHSWTNTLPARWMRFEDAAARGLLFRPYLDDRISSDFPPCSKWGCSWWRSRWNCLEHHIRLLALCTVCLHRRVAQCEHPQSDGIPFRIKISIISTILERLTCQVSQVLELAWMWSQDSGMRMRMSL